MRNQASNRLFDALDIRAVGLRSGRAFALAVRPAPAPSVGGGIDVVHEPRLCSYRRADPQGAVLPPDEHLEVIVDDGLSERRQLTARARVEEDRVPSEALGEPGDGCLGAMARSSDLAMGGAGGQPRGHGDKESGALEVIGSGERLAGTGPIAIETAEARDADRGMRNAVGAEALEAPSAGSMSVAFGPWTERRIEPRRTHAFDGLQGPPHE